MKAEILFVENLEFTNLELYCEKMKWNLDEMMPQKICWEKDDISLFKLTICKTINVLTAQTLGQGGKDFGPSSELET